MKVASFLFSLLSCLLFTSSEGILVLQLPGVNLNYPNSGTVDIEFLDAIGTVKYSIQGEYAVPDHQETAISHFFPPKLLKSALEIKSMRIKAGEIGMSVKVYGSAQSAPSAGTTMTVPALTVLMKTGFANPTAPLNIPFDTNQQLISQPEMDVNFPNQQQSGINAPNGFYIHQIEVQLQRNPITPKQATMQFIPLGQISGGGQNADLEAAANAPSTIPRDSVLVGTGPQAKPVFIQHGHSNPSSQQTAPLTQFIQAPNIS